MFFEKLAIKYLLHKKTSVFMNIDLNNKSLKAKQKHFFMYNTNINDTRVYDKNGKELIIPEGKFEFHS
jgi:hypothetical protein